MSLCRHPSVPGLRSSAAKRQHLLARLRVCQSAGAEPHLPFGVVAAPGTYSRPHPCLQHSLFSVDHPSEQLAVEGTSQMVPWVSKSQKGRGGGPGEKVGTPLYLSRLPAFALSSGPNPSRQIASDDCHYFAIFSSSGRAPCGLSSVSPLKAQMDCPLSGSHGSLLVLFIFCPQDTEPWVSRPDATGMLYPNVCPTNPPWALPS